ncbi:MAG: hypothetical protein JWM91_5093 [Rhodospirillales bacterium]|nr:hypothetical protein [Rhodospirillales bacterium]
MRVQSLPKQHEQQQIVEFLSRPSTYGVAIKSVEHIITHISHIFLAGDRAYKLKRAVRLPYVDFSTLALRRTACERELQLNRRMAPDLYQGIMPVTRTGEDGFSFEGPGEVADWLVVMRRFDQDQLLDRVAEQGALAARTLRALGDVVAKFHSEAEPILDGGGASAMASTIDGIAEAFAACPPGIFEPAEIERLIDSSHACLKTVAALLNSRCKEGKVRRCHGDLHLNNICLIKGQPVLFDCIEFSDTLGTIDVLYDLAFLLMDFIHRGLNAEANAVFNRYLDRVDEDSGIAALPFFLALRAAIRSHVIASSDGPGRRNKARSYFHLANQLLKPPRPRLIAIGGLSGTGKSTLAYHLAPSVGDGAGARVLRSDVIRKQVFGLMPEERLGPGGYKTEVTTDVYARIMKTARALLEVGQAVIVDAVFARPEERSAIRLIAEAENVPFEGLWLEAPEKVLQQRISARRNDASDADISILRKQISFDVGLIDWTRVEVSDSAECVASAAQLRIA